MSTQLGWNRRGPSVEYLMALSDEAFEAFVRSTGIKTVSSADPTPQPTPDEPAEDARMGDDPVPEPADEPENGDDD